MIDSLVESVENAFVDFNIRRLLYLGFVLSLLVGGVLLFDYATGYSHYTRLENKIDALERLQELKADGLSEDLTPVYNDAVRSLKDSPRQPLALPFGLDRIVVLKFFSSSGLWLWFILLGVWYWVDEREGWKALLFGSTFFLALYAVIGLALPDFGNPWVNITMYMVVQVISVVTLSMYGRHKRERELRQSMERALAFEQSQDEGDSQTVGGRLALKDRRTWNESPPSASHEAGR